MTSYAALMALSLIYMKENNNYVASRITIPTTIFEINICNPKIVLFKVIAKHLIMWDNIKISKDFVRESIGDTINFLQTYSLQDI